MSKTTVTYTIERLVDGERTNMLAGIKDIERARSIVKDKRTEEHKATFSIVKLTTTTEEEVVIDENSLLELATEHLKNYEKEINEAKHRLTQYFLNEKELLEVYDHNRLYVHEEYHKDLHTVAWAATVERAIQNLTKITP